MTPSEAIETGENALRSIVRELLNDSWVSLIGDRALAATEDRRQQEPKQRPGALESDDLLSYVDLPILTTLILKQWPVFKPVFGNYERAKVAFNAFTVYRRRVAHSRPLLSFERDLLSGISGQIRNQVSIYRQARNPTPQYFAVIEESADFEGRTGVQPYGNASCYPYPIISAGKTYTFTASATDPRDREIEWALHVNAWQGPSYEVGQAEFTALGKSVTMTWTPAPEDFAATVYVWLAARNLSGYHASEYGYDDAVIWAYTFEPPYQ